jgi:hypothetical protein
MIGDGETKQRTRGDSIAGRNNPQRVADANLIVYTAYQSLGKRTILS